MAKQPSGYILYDGASLFDGQRIVVIATGFRQASQNAKTGHMIQTWILRADTHPIEASRTGQDQAICGYCPHRGEYGMEGHLVPDKRSCYVNLVHGPSTVWRTWRNGGYADLTQATPSAVSRVFRGYRVRLGAYGDPAAVPLAVWQSVLASVAPTERTGYTHAWRLDRVQPYRAFLMASCDTTDERTAAKAMGWRTFRVAPLADWAKLDREILCPASAEADKKTVCAACTLCGGAERAKPDIMIPLHGFQAGNAVRRGIVRQ